MSNGQEKRDKIRVILTTLTIIAIVSAPYYFASCHTPEVISNDSDYNISFNLSGIELPYCKSDEFIIRNQAGRYTLLYDTLYRQAQWVAYMLTSEDVSANNAQRRDKFIPDPQVVERGLPYIKTSAYKNSGYDRGHLCPSADRTTCQAENDCTFYLSNISPQTPALNRGIWKGLEEQVRRWAVRYDTLCVVTGGVLQDNLPTIGPGVGVPQMFYKAVIARIGHKLHAVGFIIPNENNYDRSYESYAVSIDSLESMTHLDLFYCLPKKVEVAVESNTDFRIWFE